jgi:imidazolonepropionase-like amidohydrolase
MERHTKGTEKGRRRLTVAVAIVAAVLGGVLGLPESADAQIAVRGNVVHPVSGPAIEDGIVLVGADGRIEAVGPAGEVEVPDGVETLQAAVVTPGLVDAHSVVGLAGYLNQPHDQDQLETSSAIQPELRAIDAYNAREELVGWVRSLGTTTLHTGHGPGALMSGQTMVVKTRGDNVGEAVVDSVTMVAMTLGPEVSQMISGGPGTRAKGIAQLRQQFVRAQEYQQRAGENGEADRDLQMEILGRMLEGEVKALITANRISEIMAALRLAEEFGLDLVLDGAAEAYLVTDEIRAAGVPVIVHPTLARHSGTMEHGTYDAAKRLHDAGLQVTLQSGFEGYVPKTRVLLFEAGMAAAYGLSFEDTLEAITLQAARVIGQDHRVGSLEPGKDGDLVLYDGDPFEYVTRVCTVIIEGEVVSDECR